MLPVFCPPLTPCLAGRRAPEKLGALIIDESDLITKMLAISLPAESHDGSPMEEDADDDKVSQTAELREAVLLVSLQTSFLYLHWS